MSLIEIRGIGKAYKQYKSPWARFREWFFPFASQTHTLQWALSDVTFEVNQGEAVGIVGMNGAGKSTLLKIIAGTTNATQGHLVVNGTVSALLELGLGFHPDFTGRQNITTACQLLGMAPTEIAKLVPDIEDFAEIGSYIDQPLRVYSSGMQMRLAFAVATAQRPDVLIVDEALSVGDAYFQHKSFSRIRKFREAGTSLLIVSHDRGAIQSICDRVVLLHHGTVIKTGAPAETLDYYHALLAERDKELVRQERNELGKLITVSGGGQVKVENCRILSEEGIPIDVVEVGQCVQLEITAKSFMPVSDLVIGFMIKDKFGQVIYGINSFRMGVKISNLLEGDVVITTYEFKMNIGKGNYSVSTALTLADSHLADNYEWRDGGLIFSVINSKKFDFVGSASLDATLSLQKFRASECRSL